MWRETSRFLDGTWHRKAVKSRDVFPHKFSTQLDGEITQVPGDDLTRIGPSRITMREVVGPHAVVGAPPRQYVAADSIVEEGGVDLVVEVFAREFFDS